MLSTLLLNSNYQFISFITERKVGIFLANGKAEPLAYWDERLCWATGSMKHPSIVRLKYQVRQFPRVPRFHRRAVLRRDEYCCQYCGRACLPGQLSIDHIIPRHQGGTNNWKNCVAACKSCNTYKANRTPEEAGLTLLSQPRVPRYTAKYELKEIKYKHPEWDNYIY